MMATIRGRSAHPLHAALLLGFIAALAASGLAGCGATKAKAKTHSATPTATQTMAAKKGWNVVASPAVAPEGDLEAVSALSATSAWAVGRYEGTDGLEHTLTERWDGAQWSVVSSPSPGTTTNLLSAVSADSASDAWAVGTQTDTTGVQRPTIEHWNGSAWSVVSGPDTGKVGSQLFGVAAIAPNDVWAVGSMQQSLGSGQSNASSPLVEYWNGSAWSIMSSPSLPPDNNGASNGELAAVTALAANNVWAVGANGSQSLVEHWDGSGWSVVASPNPQTNGNGDGLAAISADSANDIWAVGSGGLSVPTSCGAPSAALIEHWDGSQWSSVNPATPPSDGATSSPYAPFSLSGVAAIAPTNVWAIGTQETYDATNGTQIVPLVEHWDGSQWTLGSVPATNTMEGLLGVTATASGVAFAVGQHHDANSAGPSLIVQLTGNSWAPMTSPSPGTVQNALNAVAATSANDVWAVGDSGDGALTEHWNGSAWSVVPSVNASPHDDTLAGVAAISANDAWAVGTAPNTNGVIEHWDGSQWSLSPGAGNGSTGTSLDAVAAVSSSSVYAAGTQNGPFVERWNGSAWNALPALAPLPQDTLQYENALGVTALSDTNVWVVGGNVYHNCAGLLPAMIQHWDGAQWTAVPNLPQGQLAAVSASGPNDVWAVGNLGRNSGVMHYDGAQWSAVSLPGAGQGGSNFTAVSARAPNDVWVVGNTYTQQGAPIVAYHWDGKTWTQAALPVPGPEGAQLNGVVAISAMNVWAVGSFNFQQALCEHYGG